MDYVLHHVDERNAKAIEARKSKELYDGRNVAKEFEKIYNDLIEMKKEGFYTPGGEKRAEKYLRRIEDYQKKRN